MLEKCLSFKDVCRLLGVSRSTLSRWLDPGNRYYDATLPEPIAIGRRKRCFLEEKLRQWLLNKGRKFAR